MGLALVVDDAATLATLPETVRAHYVEKDGKHHLNVVKHGRYIVIY
jgi:hypothetical protein